MPHSSVLECVVNISEGTDKGRIGLLGGAAGAALVHVHSDADHNRSVFTIAGEPDVVQASVRNLTREAVVNLDLSVHDGVHPRLGVVDVVPFVPFVLGRRRDQLVSLDEAMTARDGFGAWAGSTLFVPCLSYGPSVITDERTLPELRRGAFRSIAPDFGPPVAHPRAGAICIGARDVLVAWNLWIAGSTIEAIRALAGSMRSSGLRTLALEVHDHDGAVMHQLSCNVVDPWNLSLADIFDDAQGRLHRGARIVRAELVGLIPLGAAQLVAHDRWADVGISEELILEVAAETSFESR